MLLESNLNPNPDLLAFMTDLDYVIFPHMHFEMIYFLDDNLSVILSPK